MKNRNKKYNRKEHNSSTVVADKKFLKFIESNFTYFILLVLLLLYVNTENQVLNLPSKFDYYTWAIAFVLLLLMLFCRYSLFKEYYKTIYTDWVYVIAIFIGVAAFSFIIQGVVKVPLNLFVKFSATNQPMGICNCEIINYIDKVGRTDVLMYKFQGRIFSVKHTVTDLKRNDIIKNYELRITGYPSVWNTYYIESVNIQEKNVD